MNKTQMMIPYKVIMGKICFIRGRKVMLDRDSIKKQDLEQQNRNRKGYR
jgi:hypothetical protein